MDKIIRYKPIQKQSFEDFFNIVIDTGVCEYCTNYDECVETMGADNLQAISGNGCSAFDNTMENIKNIYLLKECKHQS